MSAFVVDIAPGFGIPGFGAQFGRQKEVIYVHDVGPQDTRELPGESRFPRGGSSVDDENADRLVRQGGRLDQNGEAVKESCAYKPIGGFFGIVIDFRVMKPQSATRRNYASS